VNGLINAVEAWMPKNGHFSYCLTFA